MTSEFNPRNRPSGEDLYTREWARQRAMRIREEVGLPTNTPITKQESKEITRAITESERQGHYNKQTP